MLVNDSINHEGPEREKAQQAIVDVAAGNAVLLDVRRDDEWDELRAEGALHWPLAQLKAGEMPDVPADMRVYVHCAAGARAEEAKHILLEHGWVDVTNIGGLSDWQKAGGEVE